MFDDLKILMDELAKDMTITIKTYLEKVDGLRNSDLQASANVLYENSKFILYMNDYAKYVNGGRRKFVRKVPIHALIKWIRKKNIKPRYGLSVTQLAYAIQNSIFINGVRGKNFIPTTLKIMDDMIGKELDDSYLETLTKNIDKKHFN